MSPPRRPRRRTSRGSTGIGPPTGASGEARPRARCGRIGEARALFELYATGAHSDDTLALEAPRRGYVSLRTGRPLSAAGIAELLRNPVYNGHLVRYPRLRRRGAGRGALAEAPGRGRRGRRPAGARRPVGAGAGAPTRALDARREVRQGAGLPAAPRLPRLQFPADGAGAQRPAPDGPPGPGLRGLEGGRGLAPQLPGRVYEWQIAALLATAKLDEPAKRRVVETLMGSSAPLDTRRIGRLEQELRALALDNAFGRVGDDDYLRRKGALPPT